MLFITSNGYTNCRRVKLSLLGMGLNLVKSKIYSLSLYNVIFSNHFFIFNCDLKFFPICSSIFKNYLFWGLVFIVYRFCFAFIFLCCVYGIWFLFRFCFYRHESFNFLKEHRCVRTFCLRLWARVWAADIWLPPYCDFNEMENVLIFFWMISFNQLRGLGNSQNVREGNESHMILE